MYKQLLINRITKAKQFLTTETSFEWLAAKQFELLSQQLLLVAAAAAAVAITAVVAVELIFWTRQTDIEMNEQLEFK